MTFADSIKTCFSRYADFNGRAQRPEYWWFMLFLFLANLILGMVSDTVSLIFSFATLVPSLSAGARRLHDTNRSGWWFLAPIVPYFIGFMAIGAGAASGSDGGLAAAGILGMVAMLAAVVLGLVLIVFYFLEGTKGPNKYGADPKGRDTAEVFA